MTRKSLRSLGIAFLILALTSVFYFFKGTSKPDYATLDGYYTQDISWSSCYGDFECAKFDVPIDYDNLSTGTFSIGTLRRVADDTKHRIGSLIINPGGPGASGIDYAYNAEYVFDPEITDRYDIVGFDPRGITESEPIRCYTDKEADENFAADAKPDSPQEFTEALKSTKDFIQKCIDKNDHLTAFSTANAARDMDILRALVGDEKLNYMGKSYGTFLGTLYAQFFPDRIGRVVLDGAVDPAISRFEQTKMQAVSFDAALSAFIDYCLKDSLCPLPKDHAQATQFIIDLFVKTGKEPLPLKDSSSDRTLSETLMVVGAASALYDSENGWPSLENAIDDAIKGYADGFMELADIYTGRQEDGSYPNNDLDSGAVIDCLDFADNRSVDQIKKDAEKISLAAPVFGPYLGLGGLSCKFMPKNSPVVITTTTTTTPLLIIGTTNDPATPYAWSVALHTLLPNSHLLTYVGEGHTGQGRGNACIDDAVDKYYLQGVLPAENLRCTD